MSIQVTTLKGTNSIASDRITINDNFDITKDAINDLLGIVDTTTGKFDNTGVGSNNTITTEALTTIGTFGVDVQGTGSINVQNGNLKLATNGNYIELGADSCFIKDDDSLVSTLGPTAHLLDVSDGFAGITIARRTTSEIASLAGQLGVNGPNILVFDSDTNKFKGWTGTAFVDLH